MINSEDYTKDKTKAKMLIKWFEENKREMPWRNTKDPYCIWVSEIMLQQTQVATVIPYYIRFMERFPTITDLANATLEDVHNYWQGLGYYKRGENLWKGAKIIQEKWNGTFPKEVEQIKEIPGIGPYTLGAICSIAYDMPLPAVDGNVMRVMSRWYCLSEDIGMAKNRKVFEEKVMENMPDHPSAFNQGLMELGALICTPQNPKCEECPIRHLCMAYQTKTVLNYPVKEKKLKKVEENYYILIIRKEEQIGMLKRPNEGLLANMWGFPMVSEEEWEKDLEKDIKGLWLPEVKHVFTHKIWRMKGVVIEWEQSCKAPNKILNRILEEVEYISKDKIKELPVATAYKKILKKLK